MNTTTANNSNIFRPVQRKQHSFSHQHDLFNGQNSSSSSNSNSNSNSDGRHSNHHHHHDNNNNSNNHDANQHLHHHHHQQNPAMILPPPTPISAELAKALQENMSLEADSPDSLQAIAEGGSSGDSLIANSFESSDDLVRFRSRPNSGTIEHAKARKSEQKKISTSALAGVSTTLLQFNSDFKVRERSGIKQNNGNTAGEALQQFQSENPEKLAQSLEQKNHVIMREMYPNGIDWNNQSIELSEDCWSMNLDSVQRELKHLNRHTQHDSHLCKIAGCDICRGRAKPSESNDDIAWRRMELLRCQALLQEGQKHWSEYTAAKESFRAMQQQGLPFGIDGGSGADDPFEIMRFDAEFRRQKERQRLAQQAAAANRKILGKPGATKALEKVLSNIVERRGNGAGSPSTSPPSPQTENINRQIAFEEAERFRLRLLEGCFGSVLSEDLGRTLNATSLGMQVVAAAAAATVTVSNGEKIFEITPPKEKNYHRSSAKIQVMRKLSASSSTASSSRNSPNERTETGSNGNNNSGLRYLNGHSNSNSPVTRDDSSGSSVSVLLQTSRTMSDTTTTTTTTSSCGYLFDSNEDVTTTMSMLQQQKYANNASIIISNVNINNNGNEGIDKNTVDDASFTSASSFALNTSLRPSLTTALDPRGKKAQYSNQPILSSIARQKIAAANNKNNEEEEEETCDNDDEDEHEDDRLSEEENNDNNNDTLAPEQQQQQQQPPSLPHPPTSSSAASSTPATSASRSMEFLRLLGRGASGRVYLGRIKGVDRLIAIKCVPIRGCDKGKSADEVLRKEVATLKQLHHPNIIRYLGVHTSRSRSELNILLEYAEGGSIADRLLKQDGLGLPFPEVQSITRQTLLGLSYLHSKKVIHRDLKPSNLLYTKTQDIRITDFGIAAQISEFGSLRRSCVGTPWYVAPEVVAMEPYSFPVDVWSLGAVVYELVTGKRPYAELNPIAAMFHVVQHGGSAIPDGIPQMAKDFIEACWNREAAARPTVDELLDFKLCDD